MHPTSSTSGLYVLTMCEMLQCKFLALETKLYYPSLWCTAVDLKLTFMSCSVVYVVLFYDKTFYH